MKSLVLVMAVVLVLAVLLFLVGRSNSNFAVELSDANSELVSGTKVYAGHAFSIFRIEIDGVTYLVNTRGGILPVTRSPKNNMESIVKNEECP